MLLAYRLLCGGCVFDISTKNKPKHCESSLKSGGSVHRKKITFRWCRLPLLSFDAIEPLAVWSDGDSKLVIVSCL